MFNKHTEPKVNIITGAFIVLGFVCLLFVASYKIAVGILVDEFAQSKCRGELVEVLAYKEELIVICDNKDTITIQVHDESLAY